METQKSTRSFSLRQIRDAIRLAVNQSDREIPVLEFVSVVSVDKDTMTIDCQTLDNEPIEYPNVLLHTESNDTFSVFPAVNSTVLIMITANIKFVLLIEEVESVICDIEKTHFEMTKDGIKAAATKFTFNDGNLGGLIKIQALVDKVNALENALNSLITSCKAQVVTLAPSGTFPLASFFGGNSNITPITQKSDLEDTTIIH